MNQNTHEDFIKKLDKKHPDRKWKVIGEYEHNTIPILLEDKYGQCLIKPNAMMQRSTPSIKTAIDKTMYTKNRFKELWGEDMFDYSEFVYRGVRAKSTIICKAKGHRFPSDANNHLNKRGCPDCANEAISEKVRSNTKEFVEKAISKYGEIKNSFKNTVYTTATENVIITCNTHGDFEQTPNRFLNGQICPICGYKENTNNFHNLKKKRNSSLFYIIECYNKEERFLKLGITTRSVEARFKDNYDMPYKYRILREFRYANIDAPESIEKELLNFTKSAIYKPELKFSGQTEARLISIKEALLGLFDVLSDELYYIAFTNFAKAYSGIFDMAILNSGDYSKLEIDTVMKGYEVHKKLELILC